MKEQLARLMQRLERFRPSRLEHPGWTWELGEDWKLDDDDLMRTLIEHKPAPLLFNRFPASRVMADMEAIGILPHIRSLGYQDIEPSFGGEDFFENRFMLYATHPDLPNRVLLIDIRAHLGEMTGTTPTGEDYHVRSLVLDWISMQDPAHHLPPDRLALPGQRHPGLGVFKQAFTLTWQYIHALDVEVCINIPEYFHNAVLYSGRFKFFMPHRQGRLRAMMRDLLGAGLAQSSQALHDGRVELLNRSPLEGEPEVLRTVRWTPSEQVAAFSPTLRAWLQSPYYLNNVRRERRGNHYRMMADDRGQA
jgi:hypothetical protein